ncbi:MAG: hypothetical protein H7296_11175 [Bacteroidia bacterium]|nr:hypothetical protein [Bacteroidia bacterium]
MKIRATINIAILLCTVFIGRILFENYFIISSVNTVQHGMVKSHLNSFAKKRRRYFEPTGSGEKKYACIAMYLCEENTDDDADIQLKYITSVHSKTIYPLAPANIQSGINTEHYTSSFSYYTTNRYLSLKVIRT